MQKNLFSNTLRKGASVTAALLLAMVMTIGTASAGDDHGSNKGDSFNRSADKHGDDSRMHGSDRHGDNGDKRSGGKHGDDDRSKDDCSKDDHSDDDRNDDKRRDGKHGDDH